MLTFKIDKEDKLKLIDAKTNPALIMYKPEMFSECREFRDKLVQEMQLRGVPSTGKTLQQMCQIIHDALHAEHDMKTLIEQIDYNKIRKDAIIWIMAFIPCILHIMETRVRLKILTMILVEGLSSAQGDRLNLDEYRSCTSYSQREELYVTKVQDVINTRIPGSVESPGQWQVPQEKKTVIQQQLEQLI